MAIWLLSGTTLAMRSLASLVTGQSFVECLSSPWRTQYNFYVIGGLCLGRGLFLRHYPVHAAGGCTDREGGFICLLLVGNVVHSWILIWAIVVLASSPRLGNGVIVPSP